MMTFLAWLLIGSSIFLVAFYMNIFRNTERDESYSLDTEPSVTILMAAYNEEDVVEEALENACDLDYGNYEVVLVDDGSTDSTLEKASAVESENSILTVLEHAENRGKAAALNTGLEHIDSDYVVVHDADSRIDGDLLHKAAAKLEQKENLGAVIASIRPWRADTFIRKLQEVEYRMTNFYRSLMDHIGTIDVTPGAFSMYRTADVKAVGGFDVGNLTEDLEMAWSLRKYGRDLSMIYHTYSETEFPVDLRELYDQRVRWARGGILNAFKHRDMFFRRSYGWFGVLQLPIQFIMPAIAIIGLGMIFYGVVEGVFNLLVKWSAVGFVLPNFSSFGLYRTFLGMQWKIFLPLVASIGMTGYIVKHAYDHAGEEVKHPFGLVVYIFAYFAVQASFWFAAILKELFRTKRIWT
ncbi:MAG: glycosyltransferase family 2 protein [Candidatus Nanosalina sp.]